MSIIIKRVDISDTVKKLEIVMTYGVTHQSNGYRIATDVRTENGFDKKLRLYYWETLKVYKSFGTAVKKADELMKNCYKNYINSMGESVEYTLNNMGLLGENGSVLVD